MPLVKFDGCKKKVAISKFWFSYFLYCIQGVKFDLYPHAIFYNYISPKIQKKTPFQVFTLEIFGETNYLEYETLYYAKSLFYFKINYLH